MLENFCYKHKGAFLQTLHPVAALTYLAALLLLPLISVSYTHLDVYKRQVKNCFTVKKVFLSSTILLSRPIRTGWPSSWRCLKQLSPGAGRYSILVPRVK